MSLSAEPQDAVDAIVIALVRALEARGGDPMGRGWRVVEMAWETGALVGLTGNDLIALARGALLHDLGTVAIPDAILRKPTDLTEDETQILRRHPELGAGVIEDAPSLRDLRLIVLQHHERWDGTGYPRGLSGHDIAPEARILAVVDAAEALLDAGSGDTGAALHHVTEFLSSKRGGCFEPAVVNAFLRIPHDHVLNVMQRCIPKEGTVFGHQPDHRFG